jgi:hypothetical protein
MGAHIAGGPDSRQIRVGGKELQKALWKMRAGFCFNHRLARCSVDGMLVMFKKAAVEPKCQCPKPSSFRQILGYPGPTSLQCLAEISGQCPEKLRTGFRDGALDKKSQDPVFSNPWRDGVLRHYT